MPKNVKKPSAPLKPILRKEKKEAPSPPVADDKDAIISLLVETLKNLDTKNLPRATRRVLKANLQLASSSGVKCEPVPPPLPEKPLWEPTGVPFFRHIDWASVEPSILSRALARYVAEDYFNKVTAHTRYHPKVDWAVEYVLERVNLCPPPSAPKVEEPPAVTSPPTKLGWHSDDDISLDLSDVETNAMTLADHIVDCVKRTEPLPRGEFQDRKDLWFHKNVTWAVPDLELKTIDEKTTNLGKTPAVEGAVAQVGSNVGTYLSYINSKLTGSTKVVGPAYYPPKTTATVNAAKFLQHASRAPSPPPPPKVEVSKWPNGKTRKGCQRAKTLSLPPCKQVSEPVLMPKDDHSSEKVAMPANKRLASGINSVRDNAMYVRTEGTNLEIGEGYLESNFQRKIAKRRATPYKDRSSAQLVNCLPNPDVEKLPLYVPDLVERVYKQSCFKRNNIALTVDSTLYHRLSLEACYQPRNAKLLLTLKNKAQRFMGEYDCSDQTAEALRDIITDTVMAVYIGSSNDMKYARLLTSSWLEKRTSYFNSALA